MYSLKAPGLNYGGWSKELKRNTSPAKSVVLCTDTLGEIAVEVIQLAEEIQNPDGEMNCQK